ncbi:hypothetical protein PUR61_02475 [Streptomyces sp. BE20]|uniref:hypothetical protein n=1 Tax=Streptomyces sp. BE20 TaxID=3002525 RepID=UPI002E7933EF|nr:hypothetical protein [Streptomyces sp. BE20]MEE1821071.1 hypothetical protein [Streptomyces sp. BE20]
MSKPRPRRGIIRSLHSFVDDAKEIVDELIDRAAVLEGNLRDTVIELLQEDTGGGPAGDISDRPASVAVQLVGLRAELGALREEFARLAGTSPVRD